MMDKPISLRAEILALAVIAGQGLAVVYVIGRIVLNTLS